MKMLKREQEQRQAIEMLCVDMLVPKDHLLRKIDAAVDFTHIYDLVEDLYCEDNGLPGCDPMGSEESPMLDIFRRRACLWMERTSKQSPIRKNMKKQIPVTASVTRNSWVKV